jgi:hypothetical protein
MPAAAKAELAKPSCAACQCFAPPPEMPAGADASAWRVSHKNFGKCRRFPQVLDKAPEDHCFEFIAREA